MPLNTSFVACSGRVAFKCPALASVFCFDGSQTCHLFCERYESFQMLDGFLLLRTSRLLPNTFLPSDRAILRKSRAGTLGFLWQFPSLKQVKCFFFGSYNDILHLVGMRLAQQEGHSFQTWVRHKIFLIRINLVSESFD